VDDWLAVELLLALLVSVALDWLPVLLLSVDLDWLLLLSVDLDWLLLDALVDLLDLSFEPLLVVLVVLVLDWLLFVCDELPAAEEECEFDFCLAAAMLPTESAPNAMPRANTTCRPVASLARQFRRLCIPWPTPRRPFPRGYMKLRFRPPLGASSNAVEKCLQAWR
jgi:hypothetical protein